MWIVAQQGCPESNRLCQPWKERDAFCSWSVVPRKVPTRRHFSIAPAAASRHAHAEPVIDHNCGIEHHNCSGFLVAPPVGTPAPPYPVATLNRHKRAEDSLARFDPRTQGINHQGLDPGATWNMTLRPQSRSLSKPSCNQKRHLCHDGKKNNGFLQRRTCHHRLCWYISQIGHIGDREQHTCQRRSALVRSAAQLPKRAEHTFFQGSSVAARRARQGGTPAPRPKRPSGKNMSGHADRDTDWIARHA